MTRAHPPPPPPPAVPWLRPPLRSSTLPLLLSAPPASFLQAPPPVRGPDLSFQSVGPPAPPRHALSFFLLSSHALSGLSLRQAPPPLFGYAPSLSGLGQSTPPPRDATVQASPPLPSLARLTSRLWPRPPHLTPLSFPAPHADPGPLHADLRLLARGCFLLPSLRALPSTNQSVHLRGPTRLLPPSFPGL